MWNIFSERKPDANKLANESILVADRDGSCVVRLVSNGQFWHETDLQYATPFQFKSTVHKYWCMREDFVKSLEPRELPQEDVEASVRQLTNGLALLLTAEYSTKLHATLPQGCKAAIEAILDLLVRKDVEIDLRTSLVVSTGESHSELRVAGILVTTWTGPETALWALITNVVSKHRSEQQSGK